MRGKLLALTLIAAMLGTFLVGVGRSETPFTVYADPPLITGMYDGDAFEVNIWIAGGEAIYAWEFAMSYPGFVQQLSVIDVVEGDFLKSADIGYGTYMAKYINAYEGYVSASGTLLGDSEGAYGDGILATVRFTVIEPAGEYPLDLLYARLYMRFDSELIEIDPADITVIGSYFLGPTLVMSFNPGEPGIHKGAFAPGKTRKFKTTVTNNGYAPVWARPRITSVKDTGEVITLYGGQHLYTTQPRAPAYLYVNGFTADFDQWTKTGTDPYLDAVDGSLITGNNYCELTGMFDFEDIVLNPGDLIYQVTLEGYTRSGSIDIDFDVYDQNFNWVDSLWGGADWSWHTTRWVDPVTSNIVPSLLTEAGLDAFQVVIHYYSPTGEPIGPAEVDCLRLRVEFIGLDPLWVGGTYIPMGAVDMRLDDVLWDLWPFNVGTYTSTFVVEYRYGTPDSRFPQYWATSNSMAWTWTVYP